MLDIQHKERDRVYLRDPSCFVTSSLVTDTWDNREGKQHNLKYEDHTLVSFLSKVDVSTVRTQNSV